jgi:hypothetical protein
MQCRFGKVPLHILVLGAPYPRKRWGLAVPTKNGTPQGETLETGGASSPQLKLEASALAPW